MWRRFWICSLLISHHEEGTAGGDNQGEEGDADADLLGETTNVASAEDDVDLKQQLGPRLLNTEIHKTSLLLFSP